MARPFFRISPQDLQIAIPVAIGVAFAVKKVLEYVTVGKIDDKNISIVLTLSPLS